MIPSHSLTEYIAALKNIILPLRLLVENEVFRLTVWTNPANDPKRGMDHVCQLEKTMLDVSHRRSIPKPAYLCTTELLDCRSAKDLGD